MVLTVLTVLVLLTVSARQQLSARRHFKIHISNSHLNKSAVSERLKEQKQTCCSAETQQTLEPPESGKPSTGLRFKGKNQKRTWAAALTK